jgi:hypothetical protein
VEEHDLGGNWSAAARRGDTVHRRAGPWTPAVHALLGHLRHAGFDAAPEPLGSDEEGRAVLSFLPGEVHLGWPEPMPAWVYEDERTLVGAARLLRRYHDAVATFVPPRDARWRFVAPGTHEVICHYDWAPYNALFDGHRPIAMLDWDSAGPGPRVWDVAWSAYSWVPLKTTGLAADAIALPARAKRLATFCAAYGEVEAREVLAAIVDELPFLANVIQAEADAGDPGSKRLAGWNAPARTREDAARIRAQIEVLLREP